MHIESAQIESNGNGRRPSEAVARVLRDTARHKNQARGAPVASNSRWRFALFGLFALSGFSGLIYESVWSNYLKLFLGHSAYAQALVLAIFMGGMALGAWVSTPLLRRLRNPLLGYVAVEAVIGLFGLVFHGAFVRSTSFMLDQLLPGMESPLAIWAVRWGLGSALILPQAVLLGATFPLMTAGVLRLFPNEPGRSISLLYFSNSIGAVFGVLCSGFWMIGAIGLPGTMLTAALMNFALALLVYAVNDRVGSALGTPVVATMAGDIRASRLQRLLLLVALVTGLSSFIYEIAWIRMLALVLGASTHAFELMLSAFILGLALGGLWIRRRIDSFDRPVLALGWVQLLMGVTALGTIVGYNHLFELMRVALGALQKNDLGYVLFNLSSHLIAMLVMLPVTFLAGMTLPLITYVLFRQGSGEGAIGKVYAFNTLGAIVGVALTTLVLLPAVGLKMAVLIGAVLDIGLGLLLLRSEPGRKRWRIAVWAGSVAAVLLVGTQIEFDATRMSSGVFRTGRTTAGLPDGKNVMHRDGRTATVSVRDLGNGTRVISTNGKPDAGVQMLADKPPVGDEPTMIMLGGLPLLARPDAQTAAVIGMGSGISANVLLGSPNLRSVDIIEIEEAMVEGARHFGAFSERVFKDPRAHIRIDDAKSYFASHRKRYDLIISEPSNPWVSGVSSLFSDEFYARIKTHLNKDGLLVQWMHLYETDAAVVASIVKAMAGHFADYRIYASNDSDLVLLASPDKAVPPLDEAMFKVEAFKKDFARVGWFKLADVRFQEIGSRETMHDLFESNGAPINSDFFPYVDQNAVRARFKNESFSLPTQLMIGAVPRPGENIDGRNAVTPGMSTTLSQARGLALQAQQLVEYRAAGGKEKTSKLPLAVHETLMVLDHPPACHSTDEQTVWQHRLVALATVTVPYLPGPQARGLFDPLRGKLCDSAEAASSRALLDVLGALSDRDMPTLETRAAAWFGDREARDNMVDRFVTDAWLLALSEQDKQLKSVVVLAKYKHKLSALGELLSARSKQRALQQVFGDAPKP